MNPDPAVSESKIRFVTRRRIRIRAATIQEPSGCYPGTGLNTMLAINCCSSGGDWKANPNGGIKEQA
jgi:hypothetical protein